MRRRCAPQGAVIALSGIDGAGKTSQAAMLIRHLERQGIPCVVEHHIPLGFDPAMVRLSRLVGALLRRRGPRSGGASGGSGSSGTPGIEAPAEHRRLMRHWGLVAVLVNALGKRWTTSRHLRAGRVVVYDRYTLDVVVRLINTVGDGARYTPERWLLDTLCVKPLRAYFLDVRPEVADARKPAEYEHLEGGVPWAWLQRTVDLYRREGPGLGFEFVDGDRPADEIAGQIARDVERALMPDGATPRGRRQAARKP